MSLVRKTGVFIIIILSLIGAIWSPNSTDSVYAQDIDTDWREPINLSVSGSSTHPAMVTGPTGIIHILWQDEYSQFVYRYRDIEGTWSQDFTLDLPFFNNEFSLYIDQNGLIYAFWIDQESNNFYYAVVTENGMRNTQNWSGSNLIAAGVTSYDVTIDKDNQVHLVFLRAVDSPEFRSGIYYQKTLGSNQRWSQLKALYISKYYRSLLPPPEANSQVLPSDTNVIPVNIETQTFNDNSLVFVGFENPALKRVFFARSEDNGDSWPGIEQIVNPSMENTYVTPTEIRTIATNQKTLQFWGNQEPGGNCNWQFRESDDGGLQWSSTQSLDSLILGCPDDLNWYSPDGQHTVFTYLNQNNLTLLVWDGNQWGLPQGETAINQFVDSSTFVPVELENPLFSFFENQIFLVGRDQNASQDIWFSEKRMPTNYDSWFSQSTSWNNYHSSELKKGMIDNLSTFSNQQGSAAFLWTIRNQSDSLEWFTTFSLGTMNDGYQISNTTDVLQSIPGTVQDLQTSASIQLDRLALLWQGGDYGQINTTWANLNQLNNPVGWSEVNVISSTDTGNQPQVEPGPDGKLYAIFNLPYNENRGFYWMRSENGESWTEPELGFTQTNDPTCPLIINPKIAIDSVGMVHLSFNCATFDGGKGVFRLYYANSPDGETNWSEPELISENQIGWSKLFVDSQDKIHQIWLELTDRSVLKHAVSVDSGRTWTVANTIAINEGVNNKITAILDQQDQIHILQVLPVSIQSQSIAYYLWDGEKWTNKAILNITKSEEQTLTHISSTIDRNDHLVLGAILTTRTGQEIQNNLVSATYPLTGDRRQNENPEVNQTIPTESPAFETTEPVEIDNQEIIEATEQPAMTFSIDDNPAQTMPAWLGAGLGIGIAFIFVLLIIVLYQKRT